jgi:hypothetical protein
MEMEEMMAHLPAEIRTEAEIGAEIKTAQDKKAPHHEKLMTIRKG